jgi:hypothetical protein
MGSIIALVILAVLVEAVVQGLKNAISKWEWVSLGLGALLCGLAGVDAFALLGVPLAIPVLGSVLTGLIAGRGASAVFDIWEKIKNVKAGEPPANPVNPEV